MYLTILEDKICHRLFYAHCWKTVKVLENGAAHGAGVHPVDDEVQGTALEAPIAEVHAHFAGLPEGAGLETMLQVLTERD